MKFYLLLILNFFLGSCLMAQDLNGFYRTSLNGKEVSFFENNSETITIDTSSIIKFSDFESITKEGGTHKPSLLIKLNKKGALDLNSFSKNNINTKLALVIDNKVVIAPIINGVITNGQVNFTSLNENLIDKICLLFNYQHKSNTHLSSNYGIIDTTDFKIYNFVAPNIGGIAFKYLNNWKKDSYFEGILNCVDDSELSVFTVQGNVDRDINEIIKDETRSYDNIDKIVLPVIIDGKEGKMTFIEQSLSLENLTWRNYNYYIENDGIVYQITFRVNKGKDYMLNLQVMNYIINSIKFNKG